MGRAGFYKMFSSGNAQKSSDSADKREKADAAIQTTPTKRQKEPPFLK